MPSAEQVMIPHQGANQMTAEYAHDRIFARLVALCQQRGERMTQQRGFYKKVVDDLNERLGLRRSGPG